MRGHSKPSPDMFWRRIPHSNSSPLSLGCSRWIFSLWLYSRRTTAQLHLEPDRHRRKSTMSTHISKQSTTTSTISSTVTASSITPFPTVDMHSTGSHSSLNNSPKAIVNYYYVFIALFIILLAVATWLAHRRRRKKMVERNHNRDYALSQDLDGWPNNSRWAQLHRPWRTEGNSNNSRREEGLDERGEAPPPYKREQGQEEPPTPLYEATGSFGAGSSQGRLPIPQAAVLSEREPTKPPDYNATLPDAPGPSDRYL